MMEYHKVGRGGAGNFYSPKDLEKASKETPQDLEAQHNAATGGIQDIKSQDRKPSTSGRGGAGNVTTRDVLAAETSANTNVTPSLQENKPPELGHYGRGGAGNYRIPEPERRTSEKNALDAQEQAYQKVVKDVETGLQQPEKAHLWKKECE